jgi:ribosomal protein L9
VHCCACTPCRASVSPRPHACRRARGRREEQKEEEKKKKKRSEKMKEKIENNKLSIF